MKKLTLEVLAALPVRERQALLRLNQYACRAAGLGGSLRPLDFFAAVKAIHYLDAPQRREKYFSGTPGWRGIIDQACGTWELEVIQPTATPLDPARFISGARKHVMTIEVGVLREAMRQHGKGKKRLAPSSKS